jgi:hypothetical protein
VGEHHNRGIASPHQQPLILDHDRQLIGHADRVCGSDAPFAENRLPDGQVVRLTRPDEAIARMTVLRLLGNEAGLVIVGDASLYLSSPSSSSCSATGTIIQRQTAA